MKAVVINETGDSSVLTYHDIHSNSLQPNEVRLKVEASAVNYIDTIIRSGNMPPGMMPELPFIPGVECIATVAEVGEKVSHVLPGQRVAYFGEIGASTYATEITIDPNRLVAIPSSVEPAQAAVIPVNYATAYHMLHNLAGIKAGDIVFVHAAAGGVGTAIIQLAKLVGATVIGSVGSEEKRKYILKEGADFAINYNAEEVSQKVKKYTDGRGVDASFNPVAGETMISDLNLLAPFGHLVIFGFLAGLPEEKVQDAMLNQFGKSLTISYSDIYTLYKSDFQGLKSILEKLFGLLSEGRISPKVYQQIPLENAAEAHDLLESGKVSGKLVLVP